MKAVTTLRMSSRYHVRAMGRCSVCGNRWISAIMGSLTLDRADSSVRDALLKAVVTAVRRADAAAAPATVAVASVTAPPVVRSRLATIKAEPPLVGAGTSERSLTAPIAKPRPALVL